MAVPSAESLSREGRLPEAIEVYQKALRRQPGNEGIELSLADLYRRVRNDEAARTILQTARRQHPRSIPVLRAIGILEMDTLDYDASVAAFRAALDIAPSSLELKNLLATAYTRKGDAPAALRELDAVLSHNPADGLARFLRAGIYADAGENERALLDAEKVVTAKPEYEPGRTLYAKILVRLAKCQRAAEVLRPAERQRALDADALFLLSNAYDCAGQKDLASQVRAEFETISRAEHETSENRVQSLHLVEQANQLAMQNKLSEAQDLLRQALEKNPGNAFAYSQLAKIYFSMRDAQQARAFIDKALEIQPYQPDFLFVRGVIEAGEKNFEAALASFNAVTLINPKEADAYYEIGKIWMRKNDRSRALAAFRKASELAPEDADYRQALSSASEAHP
ncbi:MAG: tetratricopeptide repeat protein [Acidobacteriota bacterium]|nr:tetratricopeptide repeat protein [Acidobacteriota bacterium]